ncbi:MAG: YicC family protein [Chlamydiales bacterium]|nr:YicC family protein [Chlamydiales bacterium]
MTAYSKTHLTHELGCFTLEIQSVNRKFLELQINLPRELSSFEPFLRKILQKELVCGHVNLTLRASFEQASLFKITPNLLLAKEIYNAWLSIAATLGLDSKSFDLKLLSENPNILTYSENTELEKTCEDIIDLLVREGLSQLVRMREEEGKALKHDFLLRLELLEDSMKKVSALVQASPEKYRQKLLQRIKESLPDSIESEERLLREMIIYAEKSCVQEEITRFYSHISQFKDLLDGKKLGIGKNLDFLTQELARELNTFGAKTSDLDSSKLILEMKTELARIREQVQNVE